MNSAPAFFTAKAGGPGRGSRASSSRAASCSKTASAGGDGASAGAHQEKGQCARQQAKPGGAPFKKRKEKKGDSHTGVEGEQRAAEKSGFWQMGAVVV